MSTIRREAHDENVGGTRAREKSAAGHRHGREKVAGSEHVIRRVSRDSAAEVVCGTPKGSCPDGRAVRRVLRDERVATTVARYGTTTEVNGAFEVAGDENVT